MDLLAVVCKNGLILTFDYDPHRTKLSKINSAEGTRDYIGGIENTGATMIINSLIPISKVLYCTMNNWNDLQKALVDFRDERDWEQFHNPKDLALALSIEAAELNELFLWKKSEEANVEKVKDELADVLAYALLLADKYNFDINEIVLNKIKKNAEKYPVDKSKGTSKKYNELE